MISSLHGLSAIPVDLFDPAPQTLTIKEKAKCGENIGDHTKPKGTWWMKKEVGKELSKGIILTRQWNALHSVLKLLKKAVLHGLYMQDDKQK